MGTEQAADETALERLDEERVHLGLFAGVSLRNGVHPRVDALERAGERTRSTGDGDRAAVGRELPVSRERTHQEEREYPDDERGDDGDERRGVLVVAAEQPAPPEDEHRDGREERRDGHDHDVAVLDVREFVGDDSFEFVVLEGLEETGGDADGGGGLRAPGRERVRSLRLRDGDRRFREVCLLAESGNDRVELWILVGVDGACTHRAECQAVAEQELAAEERAHDENAD